MSLSKEKQIALLRLVGITAAVCFAIWFFLIHSVQVRLNQRANAVNDLGKKISAKKRVIQRAPETQAQLKQAGQKLKDIEDQMVSGDTYLWIQKTLRDFEIPDQIEFTKYDPPQIIDSLPSVKVPYKIASFSVSGSATYHDLGTFLAHFENSYPDILIRRLEMEPAFVGPANKDEKLSFILELQALVKPAKTAEARPRS